MTLPPVIAGLGMVIANQPVEAILDSSIRAVSLRRFLIPNLKTREGNIPELIDATNTEAMNVIEPFATDFTPETTDSQNELGEAITSLWSAHLNAKNTASRTNEELRALRAKLGEQLSEMKKSLAKPGCEGQWSGFLREQGIPRATGDRLVSRHLRSLDPNANCVTEEVSEPTDEDVQKLFIAVWPKLRRTLRSRQSIDLFVSLLTAHFESFAIMPHEFCGGTGAG